MSSSAIIAVRSQNPSSVIFIAAMGFLIILFLIVSISFLLVSSKLALLPSRGHGVVLDAKALGADCANLLTSKN